ncbi:MAG TPA: MFS transporter [Gaiellaceae bacterium]
MSSRYRWTILAVGTLAQASFAAVNIGLPALAPALRTHYGLTLTEIGVVLGATSAGMMLTLLAWGIVADRAGERLVIVAGLAGAAAALAAIGWAGHFASLVVMLMVAGAFGASVNAASGRAVMSWFARAERGLALGIRQTAIPLGGTIAAASLPWLAKSAGLRAAFLALAAGCLAAAAAGAVWMRDPPVALQQEQRLETGPLRDPRMWLLSGGSSLLLVAQISNVFFLVVFLHQHRGVSATAAAAVLAVTQLLGAVARIASGRWSDRTGRRVVPLRQLALALAVTTALVAALTDAPLVVLVPVTVAAGTLGLSWNGLSFTAAAEATGGARSGAAIGLQQTVLGLVVAGVPVAFAAVVGATSWRLGFALAALCPALGYLALAPLVERHLEERDRAAHRERARVEA